MKVRLIKESSTTWSIISDKAVLCTFSQLNSTEALRFARSWLSSFSHTIHLEYDNELKQDESQEARSP